MKKIIILFWTIYLASSQVCEKKLIEINTSSSEAIFKKGEPKMQTIRIEKTSVQSPAKMTFFNSMRSYQYCYAKIEKAESDKCPIKFEKTKYSSAEIEKMSERHQCLVGHSCKEYECKGEDSSHCLDVKLTNFIDPREMESSTKATSMLRHTCIQKWSCKIREVEVDLHLNEDNSIIVSDPLFGTFVFPKGKNIVEGQVSGNYAKVEGDFLQTKHIIFLNCLTESLVTLCYDDRNKQVFSLSAKGTTCVGESCYLVLGEYKDVMNEEEMLRLGEVSTVYDLTRVYRLLQYLNIQTMWDINVLTKKINKIESLIGRIVSWASNKDEYFPSYLDGRFLKTKKIISGNVLASACRRNYTEEKGIKEILSNEKSTLHFEEGSNDETFKARLFLDYQIENIEAPKPTFQIDSLSYNDIAHLEQGSNSKSHSETLEEKPSFLWSEILRFFEKVGSICGFLSLMSLLFKRWSG